MRLWRLSQHRTRPSTLSLFHLATSFQCASSHPFIFARLSLTTRGSGNARLCWPSLRPSQELSQVLDFFIKANLSCPLSFLLTMQIQCCECCVCLQCFAQCFCSFRSNLVVCLLVFVVNNVSNSSIFLAFLFFAVNRIGNNNNNNNNPENKNDGKTLKMQNQSTRTPSLHVHWRLRHRSRRKAFWHSCLRHCRSCPSHSVQCGISRCR